MSDLLRANPKAGLPKLATKSKADVARHSTSPFPLTSRPTHVPFLFMSSPAEWAERRDAALKELAEFGMRLARSLAEAAEAAETLAQKERAAEAFDRVARSVRLTFALQSRLAREAQIMAREGKAEAEGAAKVRVKQVRARLVPVIREHASSPNERFEWELELDERIAEAALYADFMEGPVEAAVERLRQEMELPPDDAANDAAPDGEESRSGLVATGPP
jgi:hypothetical protein